MRIHPSACILVAGLLAACGTSSRTSVPNDRPPDLPPEILATTTGAEVRISNPERGVEREMRASPEVVWNALLETYRDFGFEPDIIDTRGRQLGVERLTKTTVAGERADQLARCANEGAGPSAASRFRITFGFVTRVVPQGSGSVLHARVQASATPVDGSSIGRVACVSTGRLEQRILGGVALKLGLPSGGSD